MNNINNRFLETIVRKYGDLIENKLNLSLHQLNDVEELLMEFGDEVVSTCECVFEEKTKYREHDEYD